MKKSIVSKIIAGAMSILLIFGMTACTANPKAPELKPGSSDALTLSSTDYSNSGNWLCFDDDMKKDVDVFMVYPTVTASMEEADRPYVRLDSGMMLEAASGWLMENEGLVSESANIFAPLYRQLNGVELDSLNSDTFASHTNATPREDVFAAFDYYLTNINKGERPFILLGHSQGAQLVIELSTTFLGNDKYYKHNKNLIAAYAIGCSVVQSQIDTNPNLKFSQSKNDTGVMVSWNATSPNEISSGAYEIFGTWKKGALMTNPITWTTNITPAKAEDNKASLVIKPDGSVEMVEAFADAAVDNEHNVLLVTTVDESAYESMSIKVGKYHRYDIPFYYESIRQNVKDRIAAFKP